MADLYTVITGIQPDQQDIVEAELLAKQILEANFPDLDLREGTAIRDLVLRPSAFILSLCKKGFDFYFDQNTLANIDDTSSTELVDNILGNLFLTRNLGTQSVINVRLYFARQKAFSLSTSTSFSTDGNLLFFPPVSTTYPATALQFDSYQNEWYIDIDLLAAERGSNYNISSGSLLYFSNFDPYFLHGEINYLAQSSISPETNTAFIARAKTAISTRNLINKPSIDSIMRQDLNYLNRVSVIGAGDAEVYRDQAEITGSVGTIVEGVSMISVASNSLLQINLPNHGLIQGQLVDVYEAGGAADPIVLKRQTVFAVIDAGNFQISPTVTTPIRALNAPFVAKVEEDIFIHQGGMVDVHCGEDLVSELEQYTLDANGDVLVTGPIYELKRSLVSAGTDNDTVPPGTSFSYSFPGHASRGAVTISQDAGRVLTLTMRSHPLIVGRMIQIRNWPSLGNHILGIVTEIVSQDVVRLDNDFPVFATPPNNLSSQVRYVYPSKDTGFSTRQQLKLSFGSGQANKTVSMEVYKFNNMDSIQEYLEASQNRVVCADLLARGFDIYVIDVELTVYDIVAPISGEVSNIISGFLERLAPGQEFILSDLVADITSQGISKIKTPLEVTYKYYTKDMFLPISGTIVDALNPYNSTSIFVLGNVTTSTEVI